MDRQGKNRLETNDGWEYAPEALGIFPRYNVLKAIQVELERLDPASLTDLPETRELLLLAGMTAEDEFTMEPIGVIDASTIADEREAFCRFIRGLAEADLALIQPLLYRRVLSQDEAAQILSRLQQTWQITDWYWYPLAESSIATVAAFQDGPFHEALSPQLLQSILGTRGIERIGSFESSGQSEQDAALFFPYYNGAEGYWSSGELDWIVYASHESSVTVGGWLLEEIKALWPSWNEKIWTSPF